MEKNRFVHPQLGCDDLYDVAGANQARLRPGNPAPTLEPPRLQPPLYEIKVLATVVDLCIVELRGPPILEQRDVLFAPVTDSGQVLGQMNRGIRIVTNAKQEHLR